MPNKYDFIILGAGGTGLAAAMYAARLGLKTLVLGFSHGSEFSIGGIITTTNIVENYPGFIRLSGEELAKKIEEHARSYDLVKIKEEKATKILKEKNTFYVKTEENEYNSKTILFATGTKWRKLDVKGSKEFENKGVNFCALCDGPLFKNKKIEIINNTNITEVKGDKSVKSVILDKSYKGSKELKLDAIFVAIGHIALSDLAKPLGVKLNKEGEIIIDHKTSETNISGIYAAGDVADKPFKQLITGVAEGCTAAYSAYEYINKKVK